MKKVVIVKDGKEVIKIKFRRNFLESKKQIRFSGIITEKKNFKGFKGFGIYSYFSGWMDTETGEIFENSLSKSGKKMIREEWLKVKDLFAKGGKNDY